MRQFERRRFTSSTIASGSIRSSAPIETYIWNKTKGEQQSSDVSQRSKLAINIRHDKRRASFISGVDFNRDATLLKSTSPSSGAQFPLFFRKKAPILNSDPYTSIFLHWKAQIMWNNIRLVIEISSRFIQPIDIPVNLKFMKSIERALIPLFSIQKCVLWSNCCCGNTQHKRLLSTKGASTACYLDIHCLFY